MSDHIRFTADEYRALCQASHPLPLVSPPSDFQRGVAQALRLTCPTLADRVSGLRTSQVRTIQLHLDEMRQAVERPGGSAAWKPTFDEWRAIARAYALI